MRRAHAPRISPATRVVLFKKFKGLEIFEYPFVTCLRRGADDGGRDLTAMVTTRAPEAAQPVTICAAVRIPLVALPRPAEVHGPLDSTGNT